MTKFKQLIPFVALLFLVNACSKEDNPVEEPKHNCRMLTTQKPSPTICSLTA